MDDKERGKLAAKAGSWFVVSSIVVKLAALITTPIFTRVLSKTEYGNVATFISWSSLLYAFCIMDLPSSTGRAKLDYPGKLREYIGSVQLLAAMITGVIITVAAFFLSKLTGFMELDIPELLLLGAYMFFSPAITFRQLSYRYQYQYKQNIAIAFYTTISSLALSLLLIFLLNGNREHFRIIGIVLPSVVLSLVFWIQDLKKGRIRVNLEYWKYGLAISVPLVLHKVAASVLTQSDRLFITKYQGSEYTALYTLVYSYSILITTITTAINDGWLPWFHDTFFEKKYDQIRKNVKPLLILGAYIGLACVALAPEAILILGGKDYMDAIGCVTPIVVGVVCQYVYTHYVNIEIHMKKTYYVSLGTTIAAGTNIVLNWIFVPMYGFIAAAYTTLVSYFVLMVVHSLIVKKKLHVNIYNEKLMFGVVVVVALGAWALQWTYDHPVIRYSVTAVGFLSFLYYFRGYIRGFLKKKKKGSTS